MWPFPAEIEHFEHELKYASGVNTGKPTGTALEVKQKPMILLYRLLV